MRVEQRLLDMEARLVKIDELIGIMVGELEECKRHRVLLYEQNVNIIKNLKHGQSQK